MTPRAGELQHSPSCNENSDRHGRGNLILQEQPNLCCFEMVTMAMK